MYMSIKSACKCCSSPTELVCCVLGGVRGKILIFGHFIAYCTDLTKPLVKGNKDAVYEGVAFLSTLAFQVPRPPC